MTDAPTGLPSDSAPGSPQAGATAANFRDGDSASIPLQSADALATDHEIKGSVDWRLVQQLAVAQRNLLGLKTLAALVKFVLDEFPSSLGCAGAELRLYDPDDVLTSLLPIRKLFSSTLFLQSDSYELYGLYDDQPEVVLLSIDHERMFGILASARSASGAAMIPLFDGSRLIGSYHLALTESMAGYGARELEVLAMLGQLISSTLARVIEYQGMDRLTLIHPVTEVGNLRAFRRDMQREISWARRVAQPMGLLFVGLDDLDDLCRSYGELACSFVQRRVAQRICSNLRATDYISQVSTRHFAILLPACNEPQAHDISERMRRDINDFAIDDGRGAVLYLTLSIGLVSWEPARHPVESTERLSSQMEREAEGAMDKSERAGGNRVSVARLGLLML